MWTIALAVVVLVLAALVVVQAWMLLSQGWTIPIGSVADWLQAVGTLAAFGALFYAAREVAYGSGRAFRARG